MASKRDYEAIAAMMSRARGRREESRLGSLLHLQQELTDYFAETNPRFDRRRFEVACISRENESEKARRAEGR